MATEDPTPPVLYEHAWLEDLFGQPLTLLPLTSTDTDLPPNAWYLVQRPHSVKWNKWFHQLQRKNIPFKILHLSDEFGTDIIGCYDLPNCKAIVRTYPRPDLYDAPFPSLVTIPLGYHHRPTPSTSHIPFSERPLVWSFHGTKWFDREAQLAPLAPFTPNDCRLQPEWNHPTATTKEEYLQSLSQTKYCPILRGNNVETFRLYEALEAGSLPVTTITGGDFLAWIEKELGLSSLYGWENPVNVLQEGRGTDAIQQEVQQRWKAWKERIREQIRAL